MAGLTFPHSGRMQAAKGKVEVQEASKPFPTHDDIEVRAFEIYVRNGRRDGRESEDWLQAEHELLEEARASMQVAER